MGDHYRQVPLYLHCVMRLHSTVVDDGQVVERLYKLKKQY